MQDCAVVAAPDTLLGERICAFIIAQQVPTDYQQLRQQLTRMGLSAIRPNRVSGPLAAHRRRQDRQKTPDGSRRRPLWRFCPISANRPETG
ncbi:hypothetical protein ACLBOM_16135 [Escherichia coli]